MKGLVAGQAVAISVLVRTGAPFRPRVNAPLATPLTEWHGP